MSHILMLLILYAEKNALYFKRYLFGVSRRMTPLLTLLMWYAEKNA